MKQEITYKYDIFLSYRHMGSSTGNHSTSVARSVAQELELAGFKVYLDVEDHENGDNRFKTILSHCKYVVVVMTESSFDERSKNFEEELDIILNKPTQNVTWVYITDGEAKTFKARTKFWGNNPYVAKIIPKNVKDLPTNKSFEAIIKNDIIGTGKARRIRKPLRISFTTSRRLGVIFIMAFIMALASAWFRNIKLNQYSESLEAWETPVVFAGGGSAKNFIKKAKSIDVNAYGEGSLYIHIPTKDAYSLLFEQTNERKSTTYCPIILSTGQFDTNCLDSIRKRRFMVDYNKRIVEYEVGESPLMVYLINYKGNKYKNRDSISVEALRDFINSNTPRIYCTSPTSGNYGKYVELKVIDSINKSRIKEYTDDDWDANDTLQVVLGNASYQPNIPATKQVTNLYVLDTNRQSLNIKICVYAIGTHTGASELDVDKKVNVFLRQLGCTDTSFNNVDNSKLVHKLINKNKKAYCNTL